MTAGCKLCGKPLAYAGAVFCGSACCAEWEGGKRPVPDPRSKPCIHHGSAWCTFSPCDLSAVKP